MSLEWKTLLLTACLILFTTISTFDAFTLDGVVPLLQKHFDLNNAHTAWMKTISSTAATLVLLFMGIAGDRVGRRISMDNRALRVRFIRKGAVLAFHNHTRSHVLRLCNFYGSCTGDTR
ncbi:hypothetical protein PRIPAC_80871 [Pristionchus pacificus]|nr:hypothetical protein PRIPAC_80871 [Pristionchus pacificus]